MIGRLWKAWPGQLARVIFAVLPIVWLARKVRWSDVAAGAYEVGASGLALAFATLMASVVLAAVRWRTMMRAYGASDTPSIAALVRHNLVGSYFNVLPSGVAGDVVRAHRLAAYMPEAASYTVIFLERVSGLFGLSLVAAFAMALSASVPYDAVSLALAVGLLGGFGLTLVFLVAPWLVAHRPAWRERVARVPVVGSLVRRVPPAQRLGGPVVALLQSVVIQSGIVLVVYFLVHPLAPAATLLVCARVVPAVILLTYIPLTPAGVGQREGAFVYMFGLAAVPAAAAFATALMFSGLIMSLSALGGVCLLAERALGVDLRAKPSAEPGAP